MTPVITTHTIQSVLTSDPCLCSNATSETTVNVIQSFKLESGISVPKWILSSGKTEQIRCYEPHATERHRIAIHSCIVYNNRYIIQQQVHVPV